MSNKGGRPKGSRTRAPVIPIHAARLALRRVQERAAAGVPEDERLLLWAYGLSTWNPYSHAPIAFEPNPSPTRGLLTPPEARGDDDET